MTEMLHQAHSKSHAVGKFRMGDGESAMQPFMDQALGDAVAAKGGAGIARSIERILSRPHAPGMAPGIAQGIMPRLGK